MAVFPTPAVPVIEPAPELDGAEYGPAMSALNDKQRKFVILLLGGETQASAYLKSGYGANSSAEALRANGSKLANDHRVQAAILEEGHRFAGARVAQWLKMVEAIATDPTQPGPARLKALNMLLTRGGSLEEEKKVVEHRHVYTVDQIVTRIKNAATKVGLDPKAVLAKYGFVEDAEFAENKPELIESRPVDKEELIDPTAWMTEDEKAAVNR